MMGWLFDPAPDDGRGSRRWLLVGRDVADLRRHLLWLGLVILVGLSTMLSVVALAWSRYG